MTSRAVHGDGLLRLTQQVRKLLLRLQVEDRGSESAKPIATDEPQPNEERMISNTD